jgi:hypothetical protein
MLTPRDVYQETLRIRRDNFGDDNLHVASTLNSIGLVLFKMELCELVIDSFARCLKIRRSLLGSVHRDVVITLYSIATVRLEAGNDDEGMHFLPINSQSRDCGAWTRSPGRRSLLQNIRTSSPAAIGFERGLEVSY